MNIGASRVRGTGLTRERYRPWGTGLITGGWAFGGQGSESRGRRVVGQEERGGPGGDMAEKGSVGHQGIGRRREGRTAGNWAGKASRRGIYRVETEGSGHGRIKGGVCCGGTGLITGGWAFGGLGSESRGPCKYGTEKMEGWAAGGGGVDEG